MLFYVCNMPTNSVLDLDSLEDVVMERYKSYTRNPAEYDTSEEQDVIGHFVMCIIASRSTWLYEIIIKGEKKLFFQKLIKLTTSEIKEQLCCAVRFLNSLCQMECSSLKDKEIIRNILILMESKAKHIFQLNHKQGCNKFHLILPFRLVSGLVAKRKVEISEGKVTIPCGLWNYVLQEVFHDIVEFEIQFFKNFNLLQYVICETEDDRLRRVIDNCMRNMSGYVKLRENMLTADDIDNECQYFPPCIANLHQILRKTHRLSYESRYQYSLFLKDIGLSVNENIIFWKNEYQKPHESSKCTHYWEDKLSRYVYQIQHMYGFIGSKTLKTSHSCQKFMKSLDVKMDGGCPFVHLDNKTLHKCLPRALFERDIEDILSHKAEPQRACAIYFRSQMNLANPNHARQKQGRVTEILSPLQFYNLARGLEK